MIAWSLPLKNHSDDAFLHFPAFILLYNVAFAIYSKYNLEGGLAPSSNKNEPSHQAHLKSLEPKMRTTTLLILPLLVASIYAESKLPCTKYL